MSGLRKLPPKELEKRVLEVAGRRTVYPAEIADLFDIDRKTAQRVIQKLRRENKLYTADKAKRYYSGSSEAGYRAVSDWELMHRGPA